MACATETPNNPCTLGQVRLFVTSFSDEFYAERQFIQKEILPAVRSYCESKKLAISLSFIKWGGRHPDQRNVAELERLQTIIENCYFSNSVPIFVNITSSSLGWVPLWGEYPEEVVEDFQEAYGLLSEDLQLLSSAFREDNLNSLFLKRDDSFLSGLSEENQQCFVTGSSASQKSCGDRDQISYKFPPHRVTNYVAEFLCLDNKRRPVLKFADDFKKKITDFIENRVAYDFCGEDKLLASDPAEFTKAAHLEFLQSKGKCVYGRNIIVQQIEQYIMKEERDVPLVILGASGSGKTSVMCLAAKNILSKVESGELQAFGDKSGKWQVFYHFVGAVPGSTSLEQMLKRLLRETGMTKKNNNCAKDLDSAAQMCCSMLSNLNTEPLILFLDAADQFSKEHGARTISWVPRKLAPQVRLVMAMVTQTDVHRALLSRETKPIEVTVTSLDSAAKQGIIKDILHKPGDRKQLSSQQLQSLLNKPSSENPLWLTLACQELRLVLGEQNVSHKIEQLPDSLLLLFDELLHRLESGPEGDLLVGALCLLEASASGLNDRELRQLLADNSSIKPPSPFEEKEETESREKDQNKEKDVLSEDRWHHVYQTLQPFLRPYGDIREGRVDFYHRALSNAVRKRYLTVTSDDETPGKTEKSSTYFFWHSKLAEFFRDYRDIAKVVEEYPYHLACLDDKFHLAQCLCDWRIFDRLYQEEYSSQLMAYWRKVGPISEMISSYEAALKKVEEADTANEAAVSMRYEKVCRVTIQAGKHQDALELLKTAMKIEEKELGARAHRMVELYALMSEIYDEKLKLNDFVSRSQLPDLRKTIHYAKKSIHIRKTLPGPYHKFKLGMSLMRLAFNMKSWDACGGGTELSGPDAVAEGNKYIDRALKIFMELNDMGHYAEALMTKGVLAPRGSMEQLKLYNQAMELCMQMYGELHILTSRLYINIGIVYEDNKDYKRSYQYFKKWARLSEEIMGPDHPKTLRAKGVLRESRYRRIAMELGEWVEDEEQLQDTEEEDERSESCEMEHSYDDTVNNILIVSQDDTSLEASLASTQAAGDSSAPYLNPALSGHVSASPPLFNFVPLLPNSYLNATSLRTQPISDRHIFGDSWWQPSQHRDPLNNAQSRLVRTRPIEERSTEQSNLLQQLGRLRCLDNPCSSLVSQNSDSNQRSSTESRSDLVYRFDNLLRELTLNRGGTLSSSSVLTESSPLYPHSQDSNSRPHRSNLTRRQECLHQNLFPTVLSTPESLVNTPTNLTPLGGCSETSFPHADNVESALREHESFNRFVSLSHPAASNQLSLTPNSSGDSIGQVFANGYLPSDDETDGRADESDHEGHSDSENFYDDNFEDYDEHYIISGEGNNVGDVLSAPDDPEVDQEILDLGTAQELDNRFLLAESEISRFVDSIMQDNRFVEDEQEVDREPAGNEYQDNLDDRNSDCRVSHGT